MKTAPGILLLFTLTMASQGSATEPKSTEVVQNNWSYARYVDRVLTANPDIESARHAVEIARAQTTIAKVFPDPELTLGLAQLDVSRRGNPTAAGVELSVPFELGGKRATRVALAQTEASASVADLAEVRRELRAIAANAFINVLYTQSVRNQKSITLERLNRLVSVNERRLASGDISEVTLMQSKVEAAQFRAEVLDAEGEEAAAGLVLLQLLGTKDRGEPAMPLVDGDLRVRPPLLKAEELFRSLERRSDVRAAALRLKAAEDRIRAEQAKRVIDLSVNLGWQHSFAMSGAPPVPASDLVAASVSVPLPFSRIYKGELQAAESMRKQARIQLHAVRILAESELRQAMVRLAAAERRVALFEEGVLNNADAVLAKSLYNYERGGATLIEVLLAERTASDVHLAFRDALADRARALVAVEQAAGATGLAMF